MAYPKEILILLISIILTTLLNTGGGTGAKLRRVGAPCKSMVVYYHEILYHGHNRDNATSAIVGEPAWGNKTHIGGPNNFGDMIAFNGPLTKDPDLHSPAVGEAMGFYIYNNKKTVADWHSFSMLFNSTEHKGILNVVGLNYMLNKTRHLSVVGGDGDFMMHRGRVTFKTDTIEGQDYYRLRMDIELYECWRQ